MIPSTIAKRSWWKIGFNLSEHINGGKTCYFIWHDKKNKLYKGFPFFKLK